MVFSGPQGRRVLQNQVVAGLVGEEQVRTSIHPSAIPWAAGVLIVLQLVGSTRAGPPIPQVAYENFGPGNTVSPAGVWVGTHPGLGGSWAVAGSSFVPSRGGSIAYLMLGMHMSGDPIAGTLNEVSLTLRLDQSNRPGAIIWEQNFVGLLSTSSSTPTTLSISGGPWLNAGQKYWLVADLPPNDTTTYHIWNSGLTGSDSVAAFTSVSPFWSVSNQTGRSLRVGVIPEPAFAAWAAALGLIVLSRFRTSSAASTASAVLEGMTDSRPCRTRDPWNPTPLSSNSVPFLSKAENG